MWDTLDKIMTAVGMFGALYSAGAWFLYRRREKRLNEPVTIRLVQAATGTLLLELPYKPPRRQIVRGEVLGFLGMVGGRERFDLAFLKSPDFFNRLADIADSTSSLLEIKVAPDELAIFQPDSASVRHS